MGKFKFYRTVEEKSDLSLYFLIKPFREVNSWQSWIILR